MFQSFSIKNFRGIKDLTISPLSRLNLITGVNNAGKTAILEAIFLHLGANNAQLPLSINALRGMDQVIFDTEELFGWMFYNRNTNNLIELSSIDEKNQQHVLRVSLEEPKRPKRLVAGRKNKTGQANPLGTVTTLSKSRELAMRYKDPSGNTHVARIIATSDKLEGTNTSVAPGAMGIFMTTHGRTTREDAERFSLLERAGQENFVVSVMRYLEPRLKRLSVLVLGGTPTINADIGLGQLIPIAYFGQGFGRLLSIICAIATIPNGTILIDEIENGLHHSVLVDTWKAISVAASRANTQIFATTHSWECIRAAHEAFDNEIPYEFGLHRLERVEEDIKVLTYDQEAFSAAMEFGLETR
jgi:hypothetical protein